MSTLKKLGKALLVMGIFMMLAGPVMAGGYAYQTGDLDGDGHVHDCLCLDDGNCYCGD